MIPPRAVGAIHRLAWATTEDQAAALIAEAIGRGCNPDDADEALALWRQMRAEDVQVIGGDGAA